MSLTNYFINEVFMLKISFLFLSIVLGCALAQADCTTSISELVDNPATNVIFTSQKDNTVTYCNSADDYGAVEWYLSVETVADINEFTFAAEIALGYVDINLASEFNRKISQLSSTEKGRKLALWATLLNGVYSNIFDLESFRLSNNTGSSLGSITLDASRHSSDSFETQVDGLLLALKYEYLLSIYFNKEVSVNYSDELNEGELRRLMNANFKKTLDQSPNVKLISVYSWSANKHLRVDDGILMINPRLFVELK